MPRPFLLQPLFTFTNLVEGSFSGYRRLCQAVASRNSRSSENFLCTQGGRNAYIRKPMSGGGVSTRQRSDATTGVFRRHNTRRHGRSARRYPTPTGLARSGIHPSVRNRDSRKFALMEFSEIRVRQDRYSLLYEP